ncbi:MAG: type II toxin-antitoxin system RelE/ParE family toxin [Nitrospira sp.]|nr:type II toxin-antitoxin system RelE/ParE family toxin [Nitrospira sp.]
MHLVPVRSNGSPWIRSIASHVRGKIWELRPEWSGTEYRFFYAAFVGQRFIILHAIQKKRQKLRERDIVLAEQRYEEVKRRSHDEHA